jgi:hypothetical protein
MKRLSNWQRHVLGFAERGGYIIGSVNGTNYKVVELIEFPNHFADPRYNYEPPKLWHLLLNKSNRKKCYKILKLFWEGIEKNSKTGKVKVIGQWHSHIVKDTIPSGYDERTMKRWAGKSKEMRLLGIVFDKKMTYYSYYPTKKKAVSDIKLKTQE